MPVNKSARFRFEIIDECLRNTKRKWSKAELLKYVNRRLELHYGDETSISGSQLRYDLENMQSEYGAPIEMYKNGREYFYRYEDPDFSIREIPVGEEDITKLNQAVNLLQQIKGFTIADEMAEIVKKLEGRYKFNVASEIPVISFEGSVEMQGSENLEDIYHAIIRKMVLKISYQAYHAKEPRIWLIHPYLLKQYDGRWYLLGFCDEKQHIVVFALDRMKEIKTCREIFIPNTFVNSDDYFRDVIGVTIFPQRIVEEVELLFSGNRAPYVLSKPLHRSQSIVKQNDDGSVHIELAVIINPELVSILLSYGKDVKILQPPHLSDIVCSTASELIKKYE